LAAPLTEKDAPMRAWVGSSSLGSAALAWDISIALRKSVLAIVPGYGMADVILQALGGGGSASASISDFRMAFVLDDVRSRGRSGIICSF
jgi:hypothetical protein